jgi:phosphonate transport system substrate-binding protein
MFLLLLAGCTSGAPEHYAPRYTDASLAAPRKMEYLFAVHPLHNPKRLFEVYQPLMDAINAQALGFTVKLEASTDYAEFEKKLYSGKFHFALPNPYQAIESERHGYRIFGKMGDDYRFRGIIVVRKDSNIRRPVDLAEASISFPAPTALAATMMPKYFLHAQGIDLRADNLKYVGSQESAIMNVFLGKTKAAGTWPPPWELFMRLRPDVAKNLAVLWETKSLMNNGLVVRNDVPKADVETVARVLLTLHTNANGRAILREMELTHFEWADSSTFDPVRKFMVGYRNAFGNE